MEATAGQRAYWQKCQRLTGVLLVVWFVVTLLATWFADVLNRVSILGFPLGFYMGAQGSLIIYLLIIWYYGRTMNQLDVASGVEETNDE